MRYVRHCLIVLSMIHFLKFAPQISEAQTIPAVGDTLTLDVATWNIEWFGNASNGPVDDARQLANVQAVIEQADIDLWGLQEIADLNDFEALLDSLGDGYDGVLATQSGTQRIGFLYKTDVFSNVVIRHILTTFDFSFAGRPPLQLEANLSVADPTVRFTFIVLHMKAFSDQDSYERRVDASMRLKNNLDVLRSDKPIIILGDFNDKLTESVRAGQPSPYNNFLQDPNYFFPSLSIEQAGLGTFCGNNSACNGGSTIDHILVTDEVAPYFVAADRFDALLTGLSNYVISTSDHLPVFARFNFAVLNATEDEAVPEAVVVAPAYPNPFAHRTTLPYTLERAAAVRIEVFDMLGRRVRTLADGFLSAGAHHAAFDAGGLPPGAYLIRVNAGTVVATQRVVRTR